MSYAKMINVWLIDCFYYYYWLYIYIYVEKLLLIFFTYLLLTIIVDVHTEIRKYGQVSCVK